MGMEQDAAKVLNEEVTLCAVVGTRGTGGKVAAFGALGGALGAAVATMGSDAVAARNDRPFGGHSGYMVLAAGKTKLGFFKMKRGLIGNGIGAFLTECQRDQISKFEVAGKGIATSAVDIELKDGSTFELEVPRASKGKAEKLQRELGF